MKNYEKLYYLFHIFKIIFLKNNLINLKEITHKRNKILFIPYIA